MPASLMTWGTFVARRRIMHRHGHRLLLGGFRLWTAVLTPATWLAYLLGDLCFSAFSPTLLQRAPSCAVLPAVGLPCAIRCRRCARPCALAVQVHLVPYSEHSSYDELRQYVAFLKPQQVGGDLLTKIASQ